MFEVIRFLVSLVIAVIEFLLGARFILKFFGANPSTPFVAWIYGNSASLISPFANIFPQIRLGDFVIDTSALVAMIVYALIGRVIFWVLSRV